MSTPPIVYSGPAIDPEVPFNVRRHLQILYQKLGNHTQAFALQNQKIAAIKAGGVTTTVFEGGSGGGSSPTSDVVGAVNNQSGVTSYATVAGDNGVVLVLVDASTIAVSLTTQTPPWFCWITNQGTGEAVITPASGTISFFDNSGASSMTLLGGYSCLVAFDGTNWWAQIQPTVPVNTPVVTDEYLAAYDATTGQFTQTALPIATTLDPGMVEPDGTTISVSPTGVISAIGGAGNATSIQGVPVSAAAPTSGQVLEYNGTDWIPATVSGTVNFVDSEVVSGSGTSWTLANTPNPPASLQFFANLGGFGAVLLIQGVHYTLSGASVTTTSSITAAYAWYRH